MNLEPLLTTQEVAEQLKLSPKTVRGVRAKGLVPLDFGGNFRYRATDVAAYIEQCAEAAKREAGLGLNIPPFPHPLERVAEGTDKVLPFRELKNEREDRNVLGR